MPSNSEIIQELTIKQNNKCAICEQEFSYKKKRKLDVDGSGKKGLLCAECKNGIEAFNRDPELIKRAINLLLYRKLPDVVNL